MFGGDSPRECRGGRIGHGHAQVGSEIEQRVLDFSQAGCDVIVSVGSCDTDGGIEFIDGTVSGDSLAGFLNPAPVTQRRFALIAAPRVDSIQVNHVDDLALLPLDRFHLNLSFLYNQGV